MNKDFKAALENFAFDAAAGRAIRHLHDIGLSPEEIEAKLDFPVPLSRIEQEIASYEEEKLSNADNAYTFERVYGKYGRSYFRKVPKET